MLFTIYLHLHARNAIDLHARSCITCMHAILILDLILIHRRHVSVFFSSTLLLSTFRRLKFTLNIKYSMEHDFGFFKSFKNLTSTRLILKVNSISDP